MATRFRPVLLLVTGTAVLAAGMAVAYAASPAPSAGGTWATPAMVRKSLPQPITVYYCSHCIFFDGELNGDLVPVRVHIVSATVRGIGKGRIVSGMRRFQFFEVRICALDYLQGGAKVSAHFIWHTRRAPVQHHDDQRRRDGHNRA